MFRGFCRNLAACGLSLTAIALTAPVQAQAPLPPEVAFPVSAKVQNADTVSVRFDIQDGYYLYHDKIAVSSSSPDVQFDPLRIPEGKIKNDQYFGEMETHRGKLNTTLPISQRPNAATDIELQVTSQGCADIGLCYPPLTQTVRVELPAKAALLFGDASSDQSNATSTTTSGIDFSTLGLGSSGGNAAPSNPVPDPALAFTPTLTLAGDGQLNIRWDIDPATYLYKDKFSFAFNGSDATLLPAKLPAGELQRDETFGDVEIYRTVVDIPLQYQGDPSGAQLVIVYQGCADVGVCYAPLETAIELPLDIATAAAAPKAQTNPPQTTNSTNAQSTLGDTLGSKGLGLTLLTFFGLGLLLSFTPCVFPMIPILSGIIVGQGEDLSTRKAFTLSAVYVLAMALCYTLVGVLVGLSGENIQAVFQTPWVIYCFAALFVALSLSMFGFYELQMPSSIQTKLNNISNRQSGGEYLGVAIMGVLSALIVGPCITAPLMALLVYIAESGDAVKGGLVLFSLSLGMGAPLLLLGTSAGKLLPRAGAWMDTVKAVFGVLMLAMAIWMLERVLPAPAILALAAVLLIVSAVYMGVFDSLASTRGGWAVLWRGLGLVLFLYGAVLLVGAASGSKSLLRPLAGLAGGSSHTELHFDPIDSNADLDQALAAASARGQSTLLDFYADWCTSCKEMEAFTFSDAAVQDALNNVQVLQVDVTDNTEAHQALLKRFGLFGPPAILFFDANGEEQVASRVIGFMSAEPFLAKLQPFK